MKIVFMGTPQAAVPSLERLLVDGHEVIAVYTQPDRPSGRGNKITFSPVKQCAIEHSIPVFQPEKIRTAEALEQFVSHMADVAVVAAYGRILPGTFLNAFPKGAVNVHFSLLPKYRGAAPVNWAIVNGETETGVTTMKMDIGLDTGAILLQRSTPVDSNENSIELMERLAILGAELLAETLESFDSIVPREQDHSAATLAPIMKREDGKIDWSMAGEQIVDRVRGFQPFPTAHTRFEGGKLTIWSASSAEPGTDRRPGEVVNARADELLIACGGGTILSISELQPEGKRRMPVRDFLNGAKLRAGDILGD